MVMDPDHPAYSDDALDETNDVDRCHHGVPFDEECGDCTEEDDEEFDDVPDVDDPSVMTDEELIDGEVDREIERQREV